MKIIQPIRNAKQIRIVKWCSMIFHDLHLNALRIVTYVTLLFGKVFFVICSARYDVVRSRKIVADWQATLPYFRLHFK